MTIATALRDDILKHRWGRPDKWVFDGASYFGAEVTAGITAWAALNRVTAPHHAELRVTVSSRDIINHTWTY